MNPSDDCARRCLLSPLENHVRAALLAQVIAHRKPRLPSADDERVHVVSHGVVFLLPINVSGVIELIGRFTKRRGSVESAPEPHTLHIPAVPPQG